LGRPFYLTFEILERAETQQGRGLRIIPAAELHADALLEEAETSTYGEDASTPGASVPNGSAVTPEIKSNVNTMDDPSNQKLTMAEIEALKMDETGSSRGLISKILQSHSTLEQKTAFSLAKYTLRKHKKYLKRFCVLPLDVASMTDWQMNERDFGKVLEIRNEMLGLIGSWANIHAAGEDEDEAVQDAPSCRYLVVDDTGGLVIAAMAERMGILHPLEDNEETLQDNEQQTSPQKSPQQARRQPTPKTALSNTITLIHANSQPNLSLLRYFGYDSNNPSPTHPLSTHLNTLSWLQLLDPQSDPSYSEPELVPPNILHTWKSSKRSIYHRKRRRWERIRTIIDTTRLGSFNGLILASYTSAPSILHRLVPLLAGGAQIAVYSPYIEPLVTLADLYSTARRTAFIQMGEEDPMRKVPSEDFPVDPTLLLTPSVQTGRVRKWQVLPGRTHPLMMGKGGAEGYSFVGTRVVPAEVRVAARGKAKRGKGRKGELYGGAMEASGQQDGQAEREFKRVKLEDEDANGNEHTGAEMMESNVESNPEEALASALDVNVELAEAVEMEVPPKNIPVDVFKEDDGAKDANMATETTTVEADTSPSHPPNEAASGVPS
jgi:tRNA (adenine-N(1)-)-methyltransferase non-catalytic subunit